MTRQPIENKPIQSRIVWPIRSPVAGLTVCELAYFIGSSESVGCWGFVWTQLSLCEARSGVKVSSVNKNQLGTWAAPSPPRGVSRLERPAMH